MCFNVSVHCQNYAVILPHCYVGAMEFFLKPQHVAFTYVSTRHFVKSKIKISLLKARKTQEQTEQ